MEDRASGIIIRTRPLTETSLIVHWLTPEHGRLATVARGARRPRSPFRGRLDLFFRGSFTFLRSRRSKLHTLREMALDDTCPRLRTDPLALHQASYGVRLIELATEEDTPMPQIHASFDDWIARLARRPAGRAEVLAFECRLLDVLGFTPTAIPPNQVPPAVHRLVRVLEQSSWDEIAALDPSATDLGSVEAWLGHLLEKHLDRVPLSRAAALSV